ncbi:MAG: Octanoyltransferase LipM [Actinobacteria bacterium ADurb.Bin346]|nr:MAG: Octanoyltransferase LipM [Actinobacteria bacterium ADurb.Bin346]
MHKNKKIRVIDTGHLTAAENMALDEAILEAREESSIPDTIRFLSFKPHCALAGYFQDVENELRLDYCRKENIDINRRITGGGSLYWGTSDIGWEIFASSDSFSSRISVFEDYYRLFCSAAAAGINNFGISAGFRPRNDIEVNGKKISGSGGTSLKSCFMFQGTLLVDIDLEVMLRALRVPVEKLKYREISSLRERITWLSRETGYCPSRQEIIKNLIEGFSEYLGVDYYLDKLSKREKELFSRKIKYFSSREHIYRIKEKKSIYDLKSIVKTKTGVLKTIATVDGSRDILKSVLFTGDFIIYPGKFIFDLESVLKNIRINRRKISEVVYDFYRTYPEKIEGISEATLVSGIFKALDKLEYKRFNIPIKYYNDIFFVESSSMPFSKMGPGKKIEYFLLPYCAKLPDCSYRFSQGCDTCGKCSISDVTELIADYNIPAITITSYEHLEDTLFKIKQDGANFFCGCCCEAFYAKHKQDFERIGLSGILINIDNSTCYDLGKEKDAYLGSFEGFTELKFQLIKKVLKTFNGSLSDTKK